MESDLAIMRMCFSVQTSWISVGISMTSKDWCRLLQICPLFCGLAGSPHSSNLPHTLPRTQPLSLLSPVFLPLLQSTWTIHSSLHRPTFFWVNDYAQFSISTYTAFSSLLTILYSCPHSHPSKSNTKIISSGKSDHFTISPKVYPLPHQIFFLFIAITSLELNSRHLYYFIFFI